MSKNIIVKQQTILEVNTGIKLVYMIIRKYIMHLFGKNCFKIYIN